MKTKRLYAAALAIAEEAGPGLCAAGDADGGAAATSHLDTLSALGYLDTIVTGDARELSRVIPDESIDMIFTDPPYLREYLWTYGMLAKLGARVLKRGGYLFAYGAGEHMPASLAGMEEKGLTYFWTLALLHHGGYPRLWHKRLMSGYKPVFVYTKGHPIVNPWMCTVHAIGMDKRFHEWGQGEGLAIKMIEMLTPPEAIILDPFVGGGTTCAAAKMLGRRYIGFEVIPDVAERARQRVALTQVPLPMEIPEQMQLLQEATP